MIKVCQYKAGPGQGEKLVQLFQPGDIRGAAEFFGMGKTASPMLPAVQNYLGNLKPNPSSIYVLVNALGAGEYWGSNINGDYFPEPALIHRGRDWGYESFYDAFPYKHHVNKDPSKSFGKVELSVWHDQMKRVELVVAISRQLAKQFGAEDVIDKLDRGLFPDVSMGCKVPYDLCSICTDWTNYRRAQSTFDPNVHRTVGQAVLAWHKRQPIRGLSVTRNDYCEHLQQMLNRILPDGRKVYAINDYPRFFDISFVFIGADKTAKVMAKLAAAGMQDDVVPSWYIAEQIYGRSMTGWEMDMEKSAGLWARVKSLKPKLQQWSARRREFKLDQAVRNEENDRLIAMGELRDAQAERLSKELAEEAAMAKRASVESARALMAKKAAQKRAEITKDVHPSQFGGKAVPVEGGKFRPDLPDKVLDQLGGCPLHEALSTPTTMGMVLKPREFQRIVIIQMGKQPLADELDGHNQVFAPTEGLSHLAPVGGEHFSQSIMRLLLPFLEDRSILEPVAKRRIVRITIGKHPLSRGLPEEVDDPFLQKVSSAYNGYLSRMGACLNGSLERITEDADFWKAVHQEGLPSGFEKVAAGAKVDPKIIIGAMGAALLLSQMARYRKEQAMMGQREPTGLLNNLVADHPTILAALAGLGALHQQGSDLPAALLAGLKGAGKVLTK